MYDDLAGPVALGVALAATVCAGALTGSALTRRGLNHLARTMPAVAPPSIRWAASGAGAIAGAAVVLGTAGAGSWWLLPALFVWGCSLVAAATCDACTQHVPTGLVRPAAIAVVLLTLLAATVTGTWRWSVTAVAIAAAIGLMMAFCWRLLGLGYGDVRLAGLAGLGVVDPSRVGVWVGLAVFIVVTLSQAIVVLARGGNRKSHFPYGPAIAAAFLVIVAI